MQTFLPYPDFARSAEVLDRQRLGKQRVEVVQLLGALTGAKKGWANHPATKMWRGHERALLLYGLAMVNEWVRRGYKDTCLNRMYELMAASGLNDGTPLEPPPWLGDEGFHLSHRSNLLRKAPEHYRAYWPDEPDNLPYVWPVD